ncbi:MAG: Hpt domain-containing protein [Planctomycetota bacterium]|nr:Hpt domain-containing protein [Planctomycetota bacterium]
MDNGTTGPAVLDRAQLDEATGGDADLIRELAELYVLDAEAQLEVLRGALEQDRIDEVHRVAHGLKGSSASVGATEAAEAFLAVEVKGRLQETEGLAEALAVAEQAFERARAALASI